MKRELGVEGTRKERGGKVYAVVMASAGEGLGASPEAFEKGLALNLPLSPTPPSLYYID